MLFEKIVGQKPTINHLIQTVQNDRISHAQLFLGPEGSGNMALALAYARYILCRDQRPEDSCGQCPSCKKFDKYSHPDLHFSFPIYSKSTGGSNCDEFLEDWRNSIIKNPYMDINDWRQIIVADNKQLIIPTKEAENVVSKLSLKSFEGGYKVVIIWMPELMRPATSNKLLKIIEEPPQKTLFLLVANSHENIIATILSRTQLVKIPQISDEDLKEEILSHSISEEDSEYILQYANGNFQKASRLLNSENVLNRHFDSFAEWMRKCYMRDYAWLMKWSDKQHKEGRESIKEFIEYSSNMVRQCLVGNYTDNKLSRLTKEEMEFSQKFARFINDRNSLQIHSLLEEAYRDISRNVYGKLVLFDLSVQMMKLLKL